MPYIKWTNPMTFFILTFAITWLFWMPAAVSGKGFITTMK